MRTSAIGWTDYSGGDLNVVTGCTPVSAGCDHCYGRAIYERFGLDYSKVVCHEDKLARLATAGFGRLVRNAAGHEERYSPKRGVPHKAMCFLVDTGDLFHERVNYIFVRLVFDVMYARDDVIWQVLTKRPDRMRSFSLWYHKARVPAPHVWLGVSVEDQRAADERVPLLLDTPAAVRFVSVEPMLGPVDLYPALCSYRPPSWGYGPEIDWVICGAESGPNRRPFDPAWAADVRDQCREAGVAYYAKQDAGLRPGVPLLLDGVTVHEWPGEV